MKHTDTRSTLALIDAILRLTEKPLWEDPEFLEWEAGQVADHKKTDRYQVSIDLPEVVTVTKHEPGPEHWLTSDSAREAWLELDDTVRPSPMVWANDDHYAFCDCGDEDDMPAWTKPMRVSAHDYPATVTHGPLMLGPEPGPVRLPADVVPV